MTIAERLAGAVNVELVGYASLDNDRCSECVRLKKMYAALVLHIDGIAVCDVDALVEEFRSLPSYFQVARVVVR